jgi:menaquinone-9 beta-reductase
MSEPSNNRPQYRDVIIAGGGLSGLALAAWLAMHDIQVLVLEKGTYPRQRVCGEYISNESRPFLESIGLDFETIELPDIDTFSLTFPSGSEHQCKLEPGGFGISRWMLDETLCKLARQHGAEVLENEPATQLDFDEQTQLYHVKSRFGEYTARFAVNATGRQGGPLVQHAIKKLPASKNWFGVKYHISADFPVHLIQINLFKGGYCGISKVENDKYCLCYLADASELRKMKGNIPAFEQKYLVKNPFLAKYFRQPDLIAGPVTTAQFSFAYQQSIAGHHFFTGDAAGFIPPLTGNGMSLAFRSAKTLGNLLIEVFEDSISRETAIQQYRAYGENYLRNRVKKGVFLQSLALSSSPIVHTTLSTMLKVVPRSLRLLTKQAVGNTF